MKYLSSNEVRQIWLKFFESKKHLIIDSAPLVPVNDPTLLWINAGVAPLKKYFDGSKLPPAKRMTNVQKCIRTNDIENVGLTARHQTFFEMLGNFSIGDYFKKEAISWGYELLTSKEYFGFDLKDLYFTYYPTDLEAKKVWLSLGVPEEKLIPAEDAFWEIGEGPCGPCTEVHFDRGESIDPRSPKELLGDDLENDRFLEIWNIVFSQYNSKPGLKRSEYPELPNKNIDTGAGLERITSICQQTETNFETDLFMPIINHVEKISNVKYEGQKEFKIIADHIRTIVMALSDGATISNEGRGYVLRRLLRRALKHARALHLTKPFLHLLVDDVAKIMEVQYPEVNNHLDIIKRIILNEEEKFLDTLSEGEKQVMQIISSGVKTIDGKLAFKLYDTYGFPIELTEEYASEHNLSVDLEGFNKELEIQRERSRDARSNEGSMHAQDEKFLKFNEKSLFIGYETLESKSKVIKVFDEGIVFDKTPFYAESGGQVSDIGTVDGFEVLNVIKLPNGQHLHQVDAKFVKGQEVLLKVDKEARNQTIKNHSATHLFHKSLKVVLGDHVHQHGSRVSPESLRFDFNNFDFPSEKDILKIEKLVNEEIKKSLPVQVKLMKLDDAKKIGAEALFSEKYGDEVRVIDMDYSIELCGGTHVNNTSEIGHFAITLVESIGSGIYRVEAITGDNINFKIRSYLSSLIGEINNLDEKLERISSSKLKFNKPTEPTILGSYEDILNYRQYLEKYKLALRDYEKELNDLKERDTLSNLQDVQSLITTKRAVLKLEDYDPNLLRSILDSIFNTKQLEVLFIANIKDEKITFMAKSSINNANNLVRYAAQNTGGNGGGKPDFARGGGTNINKLDEVLKEVERLMNE